jgi:ubiquinone/menaquinone biosynthesis C-methylase UbiE
VPAPGDSYARHWDPVTVSDAMRLIVVDDDEGFFASSGREAAAAILELVPEQGAVALDLGCGIGRIAQFVAPRCQELWLADISPRMLEMARERLAGHPSIRIVRATARGVPEVGTGTLDLAYSVLVLQHVEREDAFCMMRDVLRMLKPGGVAYLTFPNILDDGYLSAFVQYADTGEVSNVARARFYTPSEVARLVTAAGFVDVAVEDASDIVAVARKAAPPEV